MHYMNLASALDKGTIQQNVYCIQFGVLGSSDLQIAAVFISDISYFFKILESS
jgi:hypothetical protein